MRDKERPALSEAERAVLKCLWDSGPGAVREVHALLTSQGQEWKRSTVITLLQRLERKGYVASDRSQFAFVFRAAVSLEDVLCQRMTELAKELSDGDAAPLVLAFAERHRFSDQEIQRFRKMIEQMETQRATQRKPSK
jgi:BlaI family transcriptional regulator, penicillinase repressor